MSSCIGKRRFDSEEDASSALRTIRNNPESWLREKVPQKYYTCDVCGGYHLTAMPGRFVPKTKKRVNRW